MRPPAAPASGAPWPAALHTPLRQPEGEDQLVKADAPVRPRGVLFDLDETLIDSRTAWAGRIAAFLHAHLPMHMQTVPTASGRSGVGPVSDTQQPRDPRRGGVTRLLRWPVERVATICYTWVSRQVVLSAEAERVLTTVQEAGLSWGIISNGWRQKQQTFHLLGLDQRTQCIFISAAFGVSKPASAIFLAAAERPGVRPQEVLFVGDSLKQDVRGAHHAGMRTAWLQPPSARRKVNSASEADVTLATLDDLRALLQRDT